MNQDLFKKAMTQFIVAGASALGLIFMLLPWLSSRGDGASIFEMAKYVDVITLIALIAVIAGNVLIITKIQRNLSSDSISKKVASLSFASGLVALLVPVLTTMEFKAFLGDLAGSTDYGIGFFLYVIALLITVVLSYFAIQGKDKEMLSKASTMAGNMAKKVDNMTNDSGEHKPPVQA